MLFHKHIKQIITSGYFNETQKKSIYEEIKCIFVKQIIYYSGLFCKTINKWNVF